MSRPGNFLEKDCIRIIEERVLSADWYVLKKTTFDYRRRDGEWQRQSRETYDRGNGAVLLLFNADQDTVVLTRQFRFPVYVNGCADGLIHTAAYCARFRRRLGIKFARRAKSSRPI
jgi:hypothetical protein